MLTLRFFTHAGGMAGSGGGPDDDNSGDSKPGAIWKFGKGGKAGENYKQ